MSLSFRAAAEADGAAIWAMLEPVLRAGEVFALPRDWDRAAALGYWCAPHHTVCVAEDGGEVVGCYYLRPNQLGGGDHVANAGYMTAPGAAGRGVGRAMCEDSFARAASLGFQAMQFNFVVASNLGAVRLWRACGFDEVGRLPQAFRHPTLGPVDALVMYRRI